VATNFPTSLDALTNPTGASSLTSPDHAGQHADINDAVEALEAKVGINSSAVTTSLDYKMTNGIHSALNVDSGTLYVDAVNNRVGVNNSSPTIASLDVIGGIGTRISTSNDAISLSGGLGGGGYNALLIPTTLTALRVITIPDATGTVITTGNLSSITSTGTLSSLTVTGDVTVDTNTLKVDSTNNRVGVGTASPASGYQLDVEGAVRATNYFVGTNTTTKSMPRGIVAYNTATASDATITSEELQITGSSFTAVSGRSYKITYVENGLSCNTSNAVFSMRIRQTNIAGTVLQTASVLNTVGNVFFGTSGICTGIATFSSGTVNLVATLQCSTGTGNAGRTSTQYAFLLVEDLGTL